MIRKIVLSLACAYGVGLSFYAAWWYPRDMNQLNLAVSRGDATTELRHRLNTWGNVNTLLLSNLIALISFVAITNKSTD